jgi:hypothetical protein
MVPFELWGVSLIFSSIYSMMIIVPCVITLVIGRRVIQEVGRWPAKTPAIQMSIVWKLITLEVITFFFLISFFQFFASQTMITS